MDDLDDVSSMGMSEDEEMSIQGTKGPVKVTDPHSAPPAIQDLLRQGITSQVFYSNNPKNEETLTNPILEHELLEAEDAWLASADGQSALVRAWNQTSQLISPGDEVSFRNINEDNSDLPERSPPQISGNDRHRLRAELREWISLHRCGADRTSLLIKAAQAWDGYAKLISTPKAKQTDEGHEAGTSKDPDRKQQDAFNRALTLLERVDISQATWKDRLAHVLLSTSIQWRCQPSPMAFQRLASALLPTFQGRSESNPTTRDRMDVLETLLSLVQDPESCETQDTIHWMTLALKFHNEESHIDPRARLSLLQRACMVRLANAYAHIGQFEKAKVLAENLIANYSDQPSAYTLKLKLLVDEALAGMEDSSHLEAEVHDTFLSFHKACPGLDASMIIPILHHISGAFLSLAITLCDAIIEQESPPGSANAKLTSLTKTKRASHSYLVLKCYLLAQSTRQTWVDGAPEKEQYPLDQVISKIKQAVSLLSQHHDKNAAAATESLPQLLSIFCRMGDDAVPTGKYDDATLWYTTAQSLPKLSDANKGILNRKIALCYFMQGDLDACLKWCVRADRCGLDPGTAYLRFLVGLERQQVGDAITALEFIASADCMDYFMAAAARCQEKGATETLRLVLRQITRNRLDWSVPANANSLKILLRSYYKMNLSQAVSDVATDDEKGTENKLKSIQACKDCLSKLIVIAKQSLTGADTTIASQPSLAIELEWALKQAWNLAIQTADSQIQLSVDCYEMVIGILEPINILGSLSETEVSDILTTSYFAIAHGWLELLRNCPTVPSSDLANSVNVDKGHERIREVLTALDTRFPHHRFQHHIILLRFEQTLIQHQYQKAQEIVQRAIDAGDYVPIAVFQQFADLLTLRGYIVPSQVVFDLLEQILDTLLKRDSEFSIPTFAKWFRLLIAAALESQEQGSALALFQQVLGTVKGTCEYPEDEVRWLMAQAWNTGCDAFACLDSTQGEEWVAVALAMGSCLERVLGGEDGQVAQMRAAYDRHASRTFAASSGMNETHHT